MDLEPVADIQCRHEKLAGTFVMMRVASQSEFNHLLLTTGERRFPDNVRPSTHLLWQASNRCFATIH
jgi:hypothetical protein